jgi:pimeloyl-ACP methyl ester carboxylesterase
MATKRTLKLLILLIAAGIAYSLESFTCMTDTAKADSSMFKTKEGENLYLEAYSKALSLWPVKYDEVDLKTSFGKVHVIISGPERGNPLVLLHGMNASSTMWYPNAGDLSKNNRLYAIDFIAEPNKSVPVKSVKSDEDIIQIYDETFEQLNLKKFNIVGASRGGWIAVLLALHSDKIKSIILLSPARTFAEIKPKKEIWKNLGFYLFPERSRLKNNLKTLSYYPSKLESLFQEQYLICLENMKKEEGILKMDRFSNEELHKLKIPVLLLIGDHDIINDKRSLEQAKSHISDIQAEMIPNSGHFLSFDQAELVDRKITTFLAKD